MTAPAATPVPDPPPDPGTSLLVVRGLCVDFPARGAPRNASPRSGVTRVVNDVSLDIPRGTTLGLVGESGSGKTTVGRAILRLVPAAAGSVVFDGRNVLAAGRGDLRRLRRRMQIIFQDPAGSLDPRMRIGQIIAEPLVVHGLVRGRDQLRERTLSLLERCGLPRDAANRYPHEFSGGQRQRIGIARALALEPDFIVCDEPTSALDVSIQAQILNLLKDLQRDLGLSYLFISHDIAVVEHICDRVAVMQAGRIVEIGPRERVIGSPTHPYTQSLLRAVPTIDPAMRRPTPSPAATAR